MDSIRQATAFCTVIESKRSSKTLPQAEAAPKEGYSHSLVVGKWNHPLQLLGSWRTEKYCYEIDKMHQKLQRFRPVLVNRKGPILFHDNARSHEQTLNNKNNAAVSILTVTITNNAKQRTGEVRYHACAESLKYRETNKVKIISLPQSALELWTKHQNARLEKQLHVLRPKTSRRKHKRKNILKTDYENLSNNLIVYKGGSDILDRRLLLKIDIAEQKEVFPVDVYSDTFDDSLPSRFKYITENDYSNFHEIEDCELLWKACTVKCDCSGPTCFTGCSCCAVTEFVGEVIDEVELQSRSQSSHDYSFLLLDREENWVYEKLSKLMAVETDNIRQELRRKVFIDPSSKGNLTRFISHACWPNLIPMRYAANDLRPHHFRVVLFASQPILAGSELFFDYGEVYGEMLRQHCLCNTMLCGNNINLWNSVSMTNKRAEAILHSHLSWICENMAAYYTDANKLLIKKLNTEFLCIFSGRSWRENILKVMSPPAKKTVFRYSQILQKMLIRTNIIALQDYLCNNVICYVASRCLCRDFEDKKAKVNSKPDIIVIE
uniref:SET domain-containing protein n=1 Tax=Heterorhabditis bacteriophora TaxID=37862 RepID=A0A1I7WYL6_HETBA